MINTFIQILLSIFLIAIMAFISYTVYNKEYINSIDLTTSNKKTTKIFSGILDYSKDSNIEFETFNKTEFTYIDINPSINQNGGAEYSYNFWLYFDLSGGLINTKTISAPSKGDTTAITNITTAQGDNTKEKYKYLILFYKGEKQTLPLKKIGDRSYDCKHKTIDFDDQIIIKNPLVKIRNDGGEIVIDYNNINYPESYNTDASRLLCDDTNLKFLEERSENKFGIKKIDTTKYKRKFNMITIVFKEQSESEQLFYKKNASCKVYLNKQLISDRLASVDNIEQDTVLKFNSRVMKSNFSKFHINPESFGYSNVGPHTLTDGISETPALQVADLTYYNYALQQSEIDRLYNAGFNKYPATFKKIIAKNFMKGDYFPKTTTVQI
jgi:hypothetical protein